MATVPAAPLLEVEGLAKAFAGVLALHDYALRLEPLVIHGVIGPNGAGKTTLFNLLTGFLVPTAGRIRLQGRDITGRPAAEIARLGIARTFQNIRLFANLTVRQNIEVAFTTARRHRASALGSVTIERLMEQWGVAEFADRKASELSYGTQRRVEIARALALAPDFLLLDEPTAGMVEGESQDLVKAIMAIREWKGCGVIVIDHDLSFITSVCERIYVLDMGSLVASGPPTVLRDDPKVAEIYLGRKARRRAEQAGGGHPHPTQ
jgi:branched-chain amino acid transport system ATP-binding protein